MRKDRFLLCASLAFAACGGGDQTIDVVFDACQPLTISTESSDPSDRKSIEDALELWNDLAGTQLALVESGSVAISFEDAAPAHFGLYDDERGVIVVNRNIETERALTIVVAHELGHAMGLVHVEETERRSVMVPGNTETPPGIVDREALSALWGDCTSR